MKKMTKKNDFIEMITIYSGDINKVAEEIKDMGLYPFIYKVLYNSSDKDDINLPSKNNMDTFNIMYRLSISPNIIHKDNELIIEENIDGEDYKIVLRIFKNTTDNKHYAMLYASDKSYKPIDIVDVINTRYYDQLDKLIVLDHAIDSINDMRLIANVIHDYMTFNKKNK